MHHLITDNLDLWSSAHTTKSSAGRGNSSKLNLHGIKKLRELILELAVRGKLVPQDPADEPASVLLERIAAEKERLVKEKKIKKQKALPPIADDEKPFELPNGWAWARVNDSGLTSTGKTPSTRVKEYFEGEVPFVGPGQISSSGKLLPFEKKLSEAGVVHSAEANRGDILMVCIGVQSGRRL